MDSILEESVNKLQDNTIITGGHFRIFFDKYNHRIELNKGTIKSFMYAERLMRIAKEKGIKADLGILINDMATSCDIENCIKTDNSFLREGFKLPIEYQEILGNGKIAKENLKIYWEKHIRNRGKKELKRSIKRQDHSLSVGPSGIFLKDEKGYGKIILTRKRHDDIYGVPACPLIMGVLNLEQNKEYNNSINFYYIGDDNMKNIPNYFVIEKGKTVSSYFGSKIMVNNIFFKQ